MNDNNRDLFALTVIMVALGLSILAVLEIVQRVSEAMN